MGLRTSENGINLIKQFEGCYLKSYKCPAGIWTIGYGHTAGVYEGMTISQVQAESFLKDDLFKYEEKVNKYYSKYIWTQNEFDALVSFAFNIGSIDQLTANGTRNRAIIIKKMLEYNKANGKILSGLTRRRKLERELFLKDSQTFKATSITNFDYKVGFTYTLQANMFVRKSPNGEKKTYLELTTNAKNHAIKQSDGSACLKKGTIVTCKSVEQVQDCSIWLKIPSGYVCAVDANGKIYIK